MPFLPRRSFDCRSTLPCDRIGQRARWWCLWPSNYPCLGLYLPPVFNRCRQIRPRRSFRCRSTLPCEHIGQRARWWCWWPSNYPCWDCISRRYSNCCRYRSAPDDHFTAGPHCRVRLSAVGALVVLVAVQLSVLGLYLPPVFKSM